MNYFTHGRPYLDRPYFLAGTAVPDWLSAVDRKVRVRSRYAEPFAADSDPQLAEFAGGILQHHSDDHWFHQTHAFTELSLRFARQFRQSMPAPEDHRPGFLGHIVVELLLDAVLIREAPWQLDAYYQAIHQLDPQWIQAAVNRMAPRPTQRLAEIIPLFVRERFLADYVDDAGLFRRLNHVILRVGLPALPPEAAEVLPPARSEVTRRREELLTPATG